MLSETLTTAMIALGVGVGSGITGAIIGKRTTKSRLAERRHDNMPAVVERITRSAMAEAFEQHLGTKNGEIKQDIADIKAFMLVSCPSTHKLVNQRLDRLEEKT